MVTVEKFFSFSVLINKEYSYEIRAYTDALNFAKSVSPSKKNVLFTSMKALYKWWKMRFLSS